MDKVTELKELCISSFNAYLIKLTRGHPLKESNYKYIKEAMLFVNLLANYEVDAFTSSTMLDFYIVKLSTTW